MTLALGECKPDDLLLKVAQVAEELGVSVVQVTRYHRQGLLPFVVSGKAGRGEKRLTPLSAVREFVRPKPGPRPGSKRVRDAEEQQ